MIASRDENERRLQEEITSWMAAASLIAARVDRPVAMLDERGVIRLINRPMERLLQRKADAILGQRWTASFVLPVDVANAEDVLRSALDGLTTQAEITIAVGDGQSLSLSIQMQRIGRASDAGILLVVSNSRVLPDARGEHSTETDYQIALASAEFGLLLPSDASVSANAPLEREFCYSRLFQRTAPCTVCPARGLKTIGESRASVQHGPQPTSDYLLIRATMLTAMKAGMGLRFVRHGEVRLMIQARVDFLASSASLSTRERDVLTALLASGDPLGEIATQLGIKVGTVKFHVNNLLKKLGADSRMDLLRLLF